MRGIFISYRREDSEGHAGRLYEDLAEHFGKDSVFMDVVAIEPGRDFRRVIDQQVASCGVLLTLIGKSWIEARDESGRRRLDDPGDFVRLETGSALKRDIPVIPVLVHGAAMPRADQLPQDLAELAYRNAVELTHARWESDVQVLIKALGPHVGVARSDAGGATAGPAAPGSGAGAASGGPAGASNVPRPDEGAAPDRAPPANRSRTGIIVGALAAVAVAVGGVAAYRYGQAPAPAGEPVIGNKRTQTYHLRSCPGYAKVAEQFRVPFPGAAAAERAGYRRAENCPPG